MNLIAETGQEIVFYASFRDPEGEIAKLVSSPVIEIFAEKISIFKGRMEKTKDRFFFNKKIDFDSGKYLVVYSAIDLEDITLCGEELLEVINPVSVKPDFINLDKQLRASRKVFKGECEGIVKQVKQYSEKATEDRGIIKMLLAKLLPSKKIEEILKSDAK